MNTRTLTKAESGSGAHARTFANRGFLFVVVVDSPSIYRGVRIVHIINK